MISVERRDDGAPLGNRGTSIDVFGIDYQAMHNHFRVHISNENGAMTAEYMLALADVIEKVIRQHITTRGEDAAD